MTRSGLLFWIGLHATQSLAHEDRPTLGILEIYNDNEKVLHIPVSLVSAGTEYPVQSTGQNYSMHLANPIDACTPLTPVVPSSASDQVGIFLQQGGGCDLALKVRHASDAGASFVAVAQTLEALDADISPAPKFSCIQGSTYSNSDVRPDGGLGQNSSCALNDKCSSHRCMLTGVSTDLGHEVCCVTLNYLDIRMPESSPASIEMLVEMSIAHGDALAETLKSSSSHSILVAKPYSIMTTPWDLSMLWMWILATSIVMAGSMYASTRERMYSEQVVTSNILAVETDQKSIYHSSKSSPNLNFENSDADSDASMILTTTHVLAFVLLSSAMLVLLYYVHLLYFINALFMINASLAMSIVVVEPLVIYMYPTSAHVDLSCGSAVRYQMDLSLSLVLSLVPSLGMGIWWFIERGSVYIWPLQDFLAICLCCLFLECIHLPSLKIGTILLSVAFVYDVFFVYLSPYIFGSSVMIAVASEGGNLKVHLKDFCALYPSSPECFHETMPLMLRLPLTNSAFPGETMLGLGDIILPGLLIAFALRYDYCKGYPISKNYFMWTSIAYAIGLLAANIMAVELRFIVAGQPALMYINPLVLGFMACVGWKRNELRELWDGPECMILDHSEHSTGQDQTPLLKA